MPRTNYELLGVAPSATAAEIKAAYRQLCKTAHPDMGGNPALFGIINDAYEVLKDPDRRAAYDAELAGPSPEPPPRTPPPRTPPPGSHRASPDGSSRPMYEDAEGAPDDETLNRFRESLRADHERSQASSSSDVALRFPVHHRLAVALGGALLVPLAMALQPVLVGAGVEAADGGTGVNSTADLVGFMAQFAFIALLLSGLWLRRREWRAFPLYEQAVLFVALAVFVLVYPLLGTLSGFLGFVGIVGGYLLLVRAFRSRPGEEPSPPPREPDGVQDVVHRE